MACRAILHDKSVYGEDADEFRPERFLKGEKINPEIPPPDAAFGFGRRICAGRDMAEASVWITIMSLLTVFEFKGKEGYTQADYGPYSDVLVS
jgi:cytochrome P450